jgi:sugar/nucleoside kinase (ribokinase family)
VSVVAAIGSLSRDVVAGAAPRPGGAVFYAARAFARLGVDAAIVARCAADDTEALLPALEAFGLPVTIGAGSVTTCFAFHYEGEHRVMEVQAVGDPWTEADVHGWAGAALGDARWVQVGALLRTDFAAPTLEVLAHGRSLLLDGQGLVRRASTGPLARGSDVDRSALSCLRVLKLNEDEAVILAGGLEPEQLRGLGVPEVVLTLGSAGSLVVTATHAERIAPHVVERVVDPTGAGDSFSAGYLHARATGAEPVEAARAASELAAAILAALG